MFDMIKIDVNEFLDHQKERNTAVVVVNIMQSANACMT